MRTALIAARKQAGLTQEDVASRAGIDRSFYAHIERNKRNPSLEVALKIAKILHQRVEDVFGTAQCLRRDEQ